MREWEVGFVFSNSIVHDTLEDPEHPVARGNKRDLGLHPSTAEGQGGEKVLWTCNGVRPIRIWTLCLLSLRSAEKEFQWIFQGLPDPSRPPPPVASKKVKLGLLVLVVYNIFSGPTPESRSAWQRKISSAITTQGPDYLYKIMNLFLYMPIILPRGGLLMLIFFPSVAVKHMSVQWKCVRGMWKAYTRPMLILSD